MERTKELKHLIYLETRQINECKKKIKNYKDELELIEPKRYKKAKDKKYSIFMTNKDKEVYCIRCNERVK